MLERIGISLEDDLLAQFDRLIGEKGYVNRSEAMRAMTQLGQRVLEYRNQYGSLPPQSFVDGIKGDVEGAVPTSGH